jgi:hypothetical protein
MREFLHPLLRHRDPPSTTGRRPYRGSNPDLDVLIAAPTVAAISGIGGSAM